MKEREKTAEKVDVIQAVMNESVKNTLPINFLQSSKSEKLARNKYHNVFNSLISIRPKHIHDIRRNVKRFKHKRHKR